MVPYEPSAVQGIAATSDAQQFD